MYRGIARNMVLAARPISRTVILRSIAATDPRARSPTCSMTVATATAARTRPKTRAGPDPSTTAAIAPAAAAASDRVDVHVIQRPYGGPKLGRRLTALTKRAASGPKITAASTMGRADT